MVRLQMGQKKDGELVPLNNKSEKLPCYCIPHLPTREFFGRQDLLGKLDGQLARTRKPQNCCVLLHGLGGVGKTRLAHYFAETHRCRFDAMLWISADSILKVEHSFLEIAKRLGLIPADDNDNQASLVISMVKDWLKASGKHLSSLFDRLLIDRWLTKFRLSMAHDP